MPKAGLRLIQEAQRVPKQAQCPRQGRDRARGTRRSQSRPVAHSRVETGPKYPDGAKAGSAPKAGWRQGQCPRAEVTKIRAGAQKLGPALWA